MKEIIRILKIGKSLKKSYFAISFFTILLSVLTALQPLFSGWAIDEIQKGVNASMSTALLLALGVFVIELLHNFFSNISGYLGDQLSVRLLSILSNKYFQHLTTLPQAYFDSQHTGKIISRLNRSVEQIISFIHMMSNTFLQFIFGTILNLAVVMYIRLEIGLLLLALYPIYIYFTVNSSTVWQKYQDKRNAEYDIAYGRFTEAITQMKVVKSFSRQAGELSFFKRYINKYQKLNIPQSRFWHKQDLKRRLVLNIIFFGVYLLIFVRGVQGVITPGEAVMLILYGMSIRIPIFSISFLVSSAQRAVSDSRDYFAVLDEEPEHQGSTAKLKNVQGQIVFDKVRFSYDDKKDVLKGVSFEIKENEKVAFVGESGEGKTTLTNLLLRLYDPKSGGITIDGQDIATVSRNSVRANISVVFQDPNLFSGTIRENIAYGKTKATDLEIKRAAQSANADSFIRELPKGYDTEIGERGLKLSGGQQQRLAIARALLKDAPILILDEATSSLDGKSELLVHDALENLMKDRTTIIIAHRLSTIQAVDKIVSLQDGKVLEVGSPTQLAKQNGIYARLLKIQNAGNKKERQKALENFEIY